MGIVLTRLFTIAAVALVVAATACEQRLVAIARGPGAGGQDSSGGAGGRGGEATATGGHAGSAGEGEGATSSTTSGSGGDDGEGGASSCSTPKPAGNVTVCGECVDGAGGGASEFPCKCKLCDSLDHEWQAECTAIGCTCKYDSVERCSCAFDKPQESCNAIENCCPDWPKP